MNVSAAMCTKKDKNYRIKIFIMKNYVIAQ